MRKVVFVGGSSYSGTTFLDLMLANAIDGFSCGEVNLLFNPYRQHHFNINCSCGDPHCLIWHEVKRAGPDNLYATIFRLLPNVSYIVDSSKDPLWIQRQTKNLICSEIAVENVLIWKTPQEYYHSCAKRGLERGWESAWINYHKLYFRMVNSWHAVPCSQVVASTDSLRMICECIGLDYFEGKHRYWEKIHHMLFGNHSAKRHLYQKGTDAYEQSRKVQQDSFKRFANQHQQQSEGSHQAIVSESPPLVSSDHFKPSKTQIADQIVKVLEFTSVARCGDQISEKRGQQLGKMINGLKASKVYELRRRSRRNVSTRTMQLYMQIKSR